MPFVPNSFTDGSAGGTPITAATLNNLEQGIVAADITNPASAASTALTAALVARGPYYNVKDYGATGNGSTDDTAAIQAAINAASGGFGGTVYFPQGTFKTIASISVASGVSLVGQNIYATTITTASTINDVVVLASAATVERMSFGSSVTRTAGAMVSLQGSQCLVSYVNFSGYYIGIQVGVSGGTKAVLPRIVNCVFTGTSVLGSSGGIFMANYANFWIDTIVMTGPSTPAGVIQPSYGLRIWGGDTGFVRAVDIVAHGRALLVDPPTGISTFAVRCSDSLFDSAGSYKDNGGTTQAAGSAEIGGAGFAYDYRFSNVWFGNSVAQAGCLLFPSGSGAVDGFDFHGCDFVGNGYAGFRAIGAGARNWTITGGISAGNVNYGIDVQTTSTRFTITGHRSGPGGAHTAAQNIGINTGASASNEYVIVGNNLRGNTSAGISDSATGVNKVVANNLV